MKPTFYNPFDQLLKDSLRDLEARQKREATSAREETAVEAPESEQDSTPRSPPPPRGTPNVERLACSVCGGIPERLRSDGISASRHLPVDLAAKRYRDTEFCDGQGRPVVKGPTGSRQSL